MAKYINWELCSKVDLKRGKKWYEHKPDGITEKEEKTLWNINGQFNPIIEVKRPDIVFTNEEEKDVKIIDAIVKIKINR